MRSASTSKPVRLALVGAGIYARDAHLPALLQQTEHFEVAAIWSRRAESAAALAAGMPYPVEITTEYRRLLLRDDIEAVDIVLPIPAQAAFVAEALAAGKHVISEKPLAPERATAQQLLDLHAENPGQVWMVGENWRYESAFVQAAALVREGAIGRPLTVHWAHYVPMNASSKYYATEWRRAGSYPGGFLLDGGVHYVAALRSVLGEIDAVAAFATLAAPELPPLDTLTAALHFVNGVLGTLLMTFAAGTPFGAAMTITGDRGSMRVERGRIELAAGSERQVRECAYYDGVANELVAFAEAIRTGAPHRNSPAEAMADMAVVDALLRSAAHGGTQTVL
jgi:predicted dehydrogenase